MKITCDNCKYEKVPAFKMPCVDCKGTNSVFWEPKEKEAEEE